MDGWLDGLSGWSKVLLEFSLGSVFELETLIAFGLGASLVALAPVVRKYGNVELGDSMQNAGRSMAKQGIKVGVTVAGVAGAAVRGVAKRAAEAAESVGDLVAEVRSEKDDSDTVEVTSKPVESAKGKSGQVTEVTVS